MKSVDDYIYINEGKIPGEKPEISIKKISYEKKDVIKYV